MHPSAPIILESLDIERGGARLFRAAMGAEALEAIEAALSNQPPDQAGVRLFGVPGLGNLLDGGGLLGSIAASEMKGSPRPVRAILFDKTPSANWALAWHQDRVVAVRERIDVAGFGPWTRKHGALHVAPPFEVLSNMTTLRLHLDAVRETNAPLLVALGSHRYGRIDEHAVPGLVQQCPVVSCLADRGDVWLYATPVLHASEAVREPGHRRVLQVDYAVGDLPGGLSWLGL
jgi:hypothetical protein